MSPERWELVEKVGEVRVLELDQHVVHEPLRDLAMSVTKSPTVIRPRVGSQGATLRLYNFVRIHWSLRVTPGYGRGGDGSGSRKDRVLSEEGQQ